jgi:hypothetical protein
VKPNKEKLIWCTHVVSKYNLHGAFDLMKICVALLDFNCVRDIKALLEGNVPLQKKIIELVVKSKHMTQNLRLAEILCNQWKLPVEDFSELRRIKC